MRIHNRRAQSHCLIFLWHNIFSSLDQVAKTSPPTEQMNRSFATVMQDHGRNDMSIIIFLDKLYLPPNIQPTNLVPLIHTINIKLLVTPLGPNILLTIPSMSIPFRNLLCLDFTMLPAEEIVLFGIFELPLRCMVIKDS